MNALLTLLYLLLSIGIVIFVPPMVAPFASDYGIFTSFDAAKAVLLCTGLAAVAGFYSYKRANDGPFLLRLFVAALLVRIVIGLAIFTFRGQDFFGGDALTYDFYGNAQLLGWGGDRYYQSIANQFVRSGEGSGWGMVYLVAAVYGLVGRNMLAIQLMNSVIGAVTAVVIYLCAHQVFQNSRVARVAGIAVAFYPSLVLWSAQGLKDGPTVFCLALAILCTLKLGEKLSLKYIFILSCALLALIALRFYVFYMIAVAIVGAFVIGMQQVTATQLCAPAYCRGPSGFSYDLSSHALRRCTVGTLWEFATAATQPERSGPIGIGFRTRCRCFEHLGALSTIPTGVVYLLFAPFPWQITSLRQSISLPEMVVWWASVPLLVLGLWFAIKYRLRMISPILIFTVMLTLAYSVFQGNVGTAYRQRAQLLVFYFIFVAVGFVLVKERREERKLRNAEERIRLSKR